MKKALLFLTFIFNIFSFAQNPELLNNNWKITKILWNGTEYYPPIVALSGDSYFYENSVTPNIISSYFNIMSGSFTFNNDNTTFSKNFCGCTLVDYWGDNGEVNQFSGMNCDFFILPNSGNFSYNITTNGTTEYLVITNPLGNKIYYQYSYLSTETARKINLKIYPNPVSDVIFIENFKSNSFVKILDISGKIIIYKKLSGNSINVKSLSKGTYFIEIEGQNPLKFIKK